MKQSLGGSTEAAFSFVETIAGSGSRAGLPEEEATWEQRDYFRQHYPDFQLEDELFAQAGRDVMTGLAYNRRRPTGQ